MSGDRLTPRQIGGIFGSLIGGLLTGGHASAEEMRHVLRHLADDETTWRAFAAGIPRIQAVVQNTIAEELGRKEPQKAS
jgi:hypothetical protein